jgi:ABC-type dipeptide/oligopeptide/nickel transport system permease subunit
MLNRALSAPAIYSNAAWLWWVLPPALAITAAVLGFAFIGMGLEPVFNPRTARADAGGSARPAMAPREGA